MTTERTITISAAAAERITEALDLGHRIGSYYGDQARDAYLASWATSFTRLVAMGGTIHADFGMGTALVAETASGMTVGLVFHAEDPKSTLAKHSSTTADVTIPDDWPRSGEWSLHS